MATCGSEQLAKTNCRATSATRFITKNRVDISKTHIKYAGEIGKADFF
jgi:hypothetical protein